MWFFSPRFEQFCKSFTDTVLSVLEYSWWGWFHRIIVLVTRSCLMAVIDLKTRTGTGEVVYLLS